ncbi:unnamed protein product, partial [Bubo scandiacus]
ARPPPPLRATGRARQGRPLPPGPPLCRQARNRRGRRWVLKAPACFRGRQSCCCRKAGGGGRAVSPRTTLQELGGGGINKITHTHTPRPLRRPPHSPGRVHVGNRAPLPRSGSRRCRAHPASAVGFVGLVQLFSRESVYYFVYPPPLLP